MREKWRQFIADRWTECIIVCRCGYRLAESTDRKANASMKVHWIAKHADEPKAQP